MKALIVSILVLSATAANAKTLMVNDLNTSQQGLNTVIYASLADGTNQGITFSIAGDDSTNEAISDGLKKSLRDVNASFAPKKYVYQMETAMNSNIVIKIQMVPAPAAK
jgi:hypothetical protein